MKKILIIFIFLFSSCSTQLKNELYLWYNGKNVINYREDKLKDSERNNRVYLVQNSTRNLVVWLDENGKAIKILEIQKISIMPEEK